MQRKGYIPDTGRRPGVYTFEIDDQRYLAPVVEHILDMEVIVKELAWQGGQAGNVQACNQAPQPGDLSQNIDVEVVRPIPVPVISELSRPRRENGAKIFA